MGRLVDGYTKPHKKIYNQKLVGMAIYIRLCVYTLNPVWIRENRK